MKQSQLFSSLLYLNSLYHPVFAEEEETYRCVRFQKTGGCSPDGKEEDKKKCADEISSGESGYCVCKTQRGLFKRIKRETCDHAPFTCDYACARHTEYTCKHFQPIEQCTELQNAKPTKETLSCDEVPPAEKPGYCECGNGRQIMQPGCFNPSMSDMKSCTDLCATGPTPYEDLGTHQHATDAVLKQNFRKLSLKHHPDKGGDKVRFTAIREAMDVLSDSKLRRVYDMGGWDMVSKAKQDKLEKGPNKEHTMHLTLAQMYTGTTKSMHVGRRLRLCRGCDNENNKSVFCSKTCKKICPKQIEYRYMIRGGMRYQMQHEVESKHKCRAEKGPLEVEVPAGVRDGEEIKYAGEGDQSESQTPGDIVFKVKQIYEKQWSRKGIHLYRTLEISLKESLLGFDKTITHLDGRKLQVRKEGVTEANSRIVLSDEGMPDKRTGSTGKLVITCVIKYPTAPLSATLQEQIARLMPGPGSIVKAKKREEL
ncbi:unnamed protein product [Amoebophrya sp. A120]|nr:unnamed protein product [Amoebophrya sp. A120]|eukprot:GSA120T00017218001.1